LFDGENISFDASIRTRNIMTQINL